MSGRKVDINIRFWSAVDKAGPNDCWLWTRPPAGGQAKYGRIVYNGRVENANRVCWMLHFGPIPEGMEVCHTCDNSLCVNPKHLWLGTHEQNMKDMCAKGRHSNWNKYGRVKLSREQILEIRELLTKGIPQRTIAKQFNVSSAAISYINTKKRWANI